jgi:ABC-type nitrate/sulfonate/bicarbonate transport system permease component
MIRSAIRYAPLLIVALVWEGVTRGGLVSPKMLPPFSVVMAAFAGLVRDGDLWSNGIASIGRAVVGFLASVVVGMAIGGGMALSPRFRLVFNPLVQLFYPLPKSALIPLVLVWFGLGDLSKTFLVFLGCLLPMILSTFNGIAGVDSIFVWSARSLGATRLEVIREILLPAALPQILTGVRTTIAFMFLLMVTSELVIATNGLGYLIGELGDNGSYPAMFAVILTVTALGFVADRGFLMLTGRLLHWRE